MYWIFLLVVATLFVASFTGVMTRLIQRVERTAPLRQQACWDAVPSYTLELQVAQLAVQRATLLTERVFHEKNKGTVEKHDKSPVTIGDFGAQALIIAALRHHFPNDAIVAEEEAAQLRNNPAMCETIWQLVKDTKLDDPDSERFLGGPVQSMSAMLDLIHAGNSPGGSQGRIWVIDPIDGTKGFLRGGQYAVCLGLLVDGVVRVGVLGCPNLPLDSTAPLIVENGDTSPMDVVRRRGVLFAAVEKKGATSRPLKAGALFEEAHPIAMHTLDNLTKAVFCERLEGSPSVHEIQATISQQLGITQPSVCMDSQAKYASIARGAGDIYLRLPIEGSYEEKIWDHAPGDLIVRESGGEVTDLYGKRLDFSVGRTLAHNKGVVAAPRAVHSKVLKVVQKVMELNP